MKYKLIPVLVCIAVIAMNGQHLGLAQDKQSKTDKIMVQKLKCSQKMFEGIALSDFEKVTRNAEELIQLSKTEEWKVIKTVQYDTHNNEFQRTAELIIAKAKMKNIDGVTGAFAEMTVSCVRCHAYCREVRKG